LDWIVDPRRGTMDDVDHETQALLEQLGAQLVTKKSTIRQLKKDGSAPEVVSSAVKEMKELQAKVDACKFCFQVDV